jgi:hypothetical protein
MLQPAEAHAADVMTLDDMGLFAACIQRPRCSIVILYQIAVEFSTLYACYASVVKVWDILILPKGPRNLTTLTDLAQPASLLLLLPALRRIMASFRLGKTSTLSRQLVDAGSGGDGPFLGSSRRPVLYNAVQVDGAACDHVWHPCAVLTSEGPSIMKLCKLSQILVTLDHPYLPYLPHF